MTTRPQMRSRWQLTFALLVALLPAVYALKGNDELNAANAAALPLVSSRHRRAKNKDPTQAPTGFPTALQIVGFEPTFTMPPSDFDATAEPTLGAVETEEPTIGEVETEEPTIDTSTEEPTVGAVTTNFPTQGASPEPSASQGAPAPSVAGATPTPAPPTALTAQPTADEDPKDDQDDESDDTRAPTQSPAPTKSPAPVAPVAPPSEGIATLQPFNMTVLLSAGSDSVDTVEQITADLEGYLLQGLKREFRRTLYVDLELLEDDKVDDRRRWLRRLQTDEFLSYSGSAYFQGTAPPENEVKIVQTVLLQDTRRLNTALGPTVEVTSMQIERPPPPPPVNESWKIGVIIAAVAVAVAIAVMVGWNFNRRRSQSDPVSARSASGEEGTAPPEGAQASLAQVVTVGSFDDDGNVVLNLDDIETGGGDEGGGAEVSLSPKAVMGSSGTSGGGGSSQPAAGTDSKQHGTSHRGEEEQEVVFAPFPVSFPNSLAQQQVDVSASPEEPVQNLANGSTGSPIMSMASEDSVEIPASSSFATARLLNDFTYPSGEEKKEDSSTCAGSLGQGGRSFDSMDDYSLMTNGDKKPSPKRNTPGGKWVLPSREAYLARQRKEELQAEYTSDSESQFTYGNVADQSILSGMTGLLNATNGGASVANTSILSYATDTDDDADFHDIMGDHHHMGAAAKAPVAPRTLGNGTLRQPNTLSPTSTILDSRRGKALLDDTDDEQEDENQTLVTEEPGIIRIGSKKNKNKQTSPPAPSAAALSAYENHRYSPHFVDPDEIGSQPSDEALDDVKRDLEGFAAELERVKADARLGTGSSNNTVSTASSSSSRKQKKWASVSAYRQ